MKLTHNEIENKNIIENFVMGRLDQEEELAFEEHILNCDECRKKCDHLQKIIEASEINLIAENKIKQSKGKRKVMSGVQFRILLGAAASLLILVGTIFLIYNTKKPSYIASNEESITDSVVISSNNNADLSDKNDTTPVEKIEIQEEKPENILPDDHQKPLIAQAFHTHPIFESAIENQLRSSGISVSSPQNSEIYSKKQEIKFIWKTNAETELVLIIRDNSGIILFKEKVPSPFIYRINAFGLYYWQLMDKDDIIYTGKFLVK